MIKFAIKIIRINITIIIITLLIVFQSTNVISQENYFQITNYEIKEKITTNFSREKIIEKTSADLIEELYEDFIDQYQKGKFVEGVCEWNGDDALMGPESVAQGVGRNACLGIFARF